MFRKQKILREEINTDPLGRGYSGMTDQQVADSLNSVNISVTGNGTIAKFIGAIKPGAWPQGDGTAASDAKASADRDYCIMLTSNSDGIIPFDEPEIRLKLTDATNGIFKDSAQTITALQSLWTKTISRASQLGLPFIRVGFVTEVR